MPALPIQYLHLETGILPVFLAMMIWTQLARATEGGHYTQAGRTQAIWLSIGFGLLTIAFGGLLYNVSPLLAVELAAGVVLSLMHPVNALCFFVHLLFLRPWEIATSNPLLLTLPRLLAALCFISWLIHPGQHAKLSRPAVRALLIFLAFSIWLFLSTFQTPHVVDSQVDWLNAYFKSLIVFVMCLFFIESEKSAWEFEMTLVISALALMAVGMYQFSTVGTKSGRLETIGMFGNSNDLAAIIVIALPLALTHLFGQGTHLAKQVGALLFTGFSLMVILLTKSRGAMLALAVQVLAVCNLKISQYKWFKTLFLAGILGIGYFIALHTIPRSTMEMEVSSESRISYWKTAATMSLEHPVFGVGFDEFPANVWQHQTVHSSWLLAFAESGLIGGLLFISFFLSVLRTAWRNRARWPHQLIALAGYGTAMSFLSHTYSIYLYLLSGLILASDALPGQSLHGDSSSQL
jgi:O-antigen ligase